MNQIYVLILPPSEDIFLRPRTYEETITKTSFSVWFCLTQTVKISLILWTQPQTVWFFSLFCVRETHWVWKNLVSFSSFIAALFIIARTWKEPRCPSADKWIRKLCYIYKCFKTMMRLVIFLCHVYLNHTHILKALCELLHKLSSLQCPSERELDMLCNSMCAFYQQLSRESTM